MRLVPLIFVLFPLSLKTEPSPFIVQDAPEEKHASKTSLKEEIGEHMKGTLQRCATLSRELAQLQAQLATIQQQLFTKVEELIDNRKPFKRATRVELNQSSKVLAQAEQLLASQVHQVQQLAQQINADANLKNVEKRKEHA